MINFGKESIKSIVIFDVLLIYWKFFIYNSSWHSHTDVYSISSDSAHWLIKGLHQPSGKQFKIASYVQAKEYFNRVYSHTPISYSDPYMYTYQGHKGIIEVLLTKHIRHL